MVRNAQLFLFQTWLFFLHIQQKYLKIGRAMLKHQMVLQVQGTSTQHGFNQEHGDALLSCHCSAGVDALCPSLFVSKINASHAQRHTPV